MNSVTQGVIKHKVGLLNLAAELSNVSRACKVQSLPNVIFVEDLANWERPCMVSVRRTQIDYPG
jgi:hypothetical protein